MPTNLNSDATKKSGTSSGVAPAYVFGKITAKGGKDDSSLPIFADLVVASGTAGGKNSTVSLGRDDRTNNASRNNANDAPSSIQRDNNQSQRSKSTSGTLASSQVSQPIAKTKTNDTKTVDQKQANQSASSNRSAEASPERDDAPKKTSDAAAPTDDKSTDADTSIGSTDTTSATTVSSDEIAVDTTDISLTNADLLLSAMMPLPLLNSQTTPLKPGTEETDSKAEGEADETEQPVDPLTSLLPTDAPPQDQVAGEKAGVFTNSQTSGAANQPVLPENYFLNTKNKDADLPQGTTEVSGATNKSATGNESLISLRSLEQNSVEHQENVSPEQASQVTATNQADTATTQSDIISPWQMMLLGKSASADQGQKGGQYSDSQKNETNSNDTYQPLSAQDITAASSFKMMTQDQLSPANIPTASGLSGHADKLGLTGLAEGSKTLIANSVTTATPTQRSGSASLPTAVEQVVFHLSKSAKSSSDQLSLQLNPTDLGKVTVNLDMQKDGTVRGTVVADNPETLSSLMKDQRTLERALSDAGLKADQGCLQFSLGQQADHSGKGTQQGSSGSGATTQDPTMADDTIDAIVPTEVYQISPTRVNIRV